MNAGKSGNSKGFTNFSWPLYDLVNPEDTGRVSVGLSGSIFPSILD